MSRRPRNERYQVPRRFGLRTMLFATALMAGTLGVFKWLDVPLAELLFYVSFVTVVAGAQVVFEKTPRLASILAGAFYLPLLDLADLIFANELESINSAAAAGLLPQGQLLYAFLFGALYGYLSGAMLAGMFLVMDKMRTLAQWSFRPRGIPSEAS